MYQGLSQAKDQVLQTTWPGFRLNILLSPLVFQEKVILSIPIFKAYTSRHYIVTSVGKKRRAQTKDEEHYLHYTPSDLHSEQG